MADPVDEKSISIRNESISRSIITNNINNTYNNAPPAQQIDNKSIETELCTGIERFSIN